MWSPEPDYLDKNPYPVADEGPGPEIPVPTDDRGDAFADQSGPMTIARRPTGATPQPFAELPHAAPVRAKAQPEVDAPQYETIMASRETPRRSAPMAEPAAAGAGGDGSEYDDVLKAISGQQPVDDYTWASRLGAEGASLGRPDRKPNYTAADDNARAVADARQEPVRAYQRSQLLAQARRNDEERAPLSDAYLAGFKAPKGLDKAGLKAWVDLRVKDSEAQKNLREPAEKTPPVLAEYEIARQQDPTLTFVDFMGRRGAAAPSTQAAGVRAGVTRDVEAKKAALAQKKLDMQTAQGEAKVALQREIAGLEAELKREGFGVQERVADKRLAAAEDARVQGDVTRLATKLTPLAQTFSAFQAFQRAYPNALTPEFNTNLNWLDRILASNPLGAPTRKLLPADKQRLDRMQQNFVDIVKRARTGAAANSMEDKTYERILGTDFSASPEAFPQAIRDFAAAFQAQVRSSERGVRPGAVPRYTQGDPNSVPSSDADVFREVLDAPAGTTKETAVDVEPPPPGRARIYELGPDGEPTGEVYEVAADDPRVADAEQDSGYHVVKTP